MTYKGIIKVSKEVERECQEILDLAEKLYEEKDDIYEGVYKTFSYTFANGYFVEIRVEVGQVNAYIDAVLYDHEGYEINVMEPEFELLGEYWFEDKGDSYTVELVIA